MLPAWKTSVQATQIKSCFLTASTCHCLAWHFVTCFQRWWKFYSTLLETATKFTSAGLRYCWDVGRRGFKPKEVFCLISVFLIISRFIFFYHLWQEISLGTAVSFGLHLSRSWQPEWLNTFTSTPTDVWAPLSYWRLTFQKHVSLLSRSLIELLCRLSHLSKMQWC